MQTRKKAERMRFLGKNAKSHYVCRGGCKGVSKTKGNCQALGCKRYQYPLEKCDCEDGKHYKAKGLD